MKKADFTRIVQMFEEAKDDQQEPLALDYLLVKTPDAIFKHDFGAQASLNEVRSISKTVLTMFFGVVQRLVDEGKVGTMGTIDEETYIYPIIKDAIQLENMANLEKLQQVQIKHLLTHTVGYDEVLLMRDDIREMDPYDYLDYVVNAPIVYEPGAHFLYSNAGCYLLAVVLQEFLGEDLLTVMARELFHPLGISNFKWEYYGDYIAGATRLWLLPEDLMKIGELLLGEGTFAGKELFTSAWLRKMIEPRVLIEQNDSAAMTFRMYAYGYGIWLPKADFYFAHGTDGQILVLLPEANVIILTMAHQQDIKPIEKILNEIIENDLYI